MRQFLVRRICQAGELRRGVKRVVYANRSPTALRNTFLFFLVFRSQTFIVEDQNLATLTALLVAATVTSAFVAPGVST